MSHSPAGVITKAKLISDYRCAQCHGALVEMWKGGIFIVACPRECWPGGFVASKVLDEQRAQAAADLVEVALAYPDLQPGVLPSAEQAAVMKRALFGEES